jgi:homoserine dehydrogenase
LKLTESVTVLINFYIVENLMKPIKVGLLGIGTVGSGVFHVLQRNQQEITRRAGRGIEITMVAASEYGTGS